MAGKKPPSLNLDALTGDLAALRMLAGDAMMDEACELLRERMGLTPEKVMLVLLRRVFPDAEIDQSVEEPRLRGMSYKALKAAKDNAEWPTQINGTHKTVLHKP